MAASMYAGRQMGSGAQIPLFTEGPRAGQLDVNTLINNMTDRTPWQWYDTLKLAPGATVVGQYVMFQQQKGQPDQYNGSQVKTFVETNMLTGGSFSPPYDLLMNRIMFEFNPDANLYDIIQFVKFAYFELTIGEKVFNRGSILLYPSGTGVYGVAQSNQSVWTNGEANPYATRDFGDWSRYIPPQFNFAVTFYFPETVGAATNTASGQTTNLSPAQVNAGQTAAALPILLTQAQGGAGLWVKTYLDGLTDRPVQ